MINGKISQFLDTGWYSESTLYFDGYIYWCEADTDIETGITEFIVDRWKAEMGEDMLYHSLMNSQGELESKSMVYHKPGCRYIGRIKGENLMHISRHDARNEGYHVCRYCNGMDHHYRGEKEALDFYGRIRKMEFNYVDGILYVKTEIGCWKLVYIRKEEKIALFHRNNSSKPVDFEKPQFDSYHRQEDKPYCSTIESILYYIYEHDKYKAAIARGETVTKFSSKKYARKEAKAQRKREINRVDYLFRMLEKQDKGMKQLSVC